MDRKIGECIQVDRGIDKKMYGWIDEQTDGQIHGWIDIEYRQIVGLIQIDGWRNR